MQAAETEAQQMHQQAVALIPVFPSPVRATANSPQPIAATAQPAVASRGTSPQPLAPSPPPPVTDTASLSLPVARQLARVQAAKAEALLAAAQALKGMQEDSAKYAVPGKDAAVIKQFLAEAGMLVGCSVHIMLLIVCLAKHWRGHRRDSVHATAEVQHHQSHLWWNTAYVHVTVLAVLSQLRIFTLVAQFPTCPSTDPSQSPHDIPQTAAIQAEKWW